MRDGPTIAFFRRNIGNPDGYQKKGVAGEAKGMRIHGRKRKKMDERGRVSASGTGAGDLLVSDAVRGGSLVGRPIMLMGLEPAVVSGRPATHPVELGARIDS